MATMPSGREMYSVKPFEPPSLDASAVEKMRAPPDRADDFGGHDGSSDEETEEQDPVGAFPGTKDDYSRGSNYY